MPLILQLTTLLVRVPHRVKLVRVGHPARLLPQALDSTLDAQVLRGDNISLANDIRKETKASTVKLQKAKDSNTKKDIRNDSSSCRIFPDLNLGELHCESGDSFAYADQVNEAVGCRKWSI
ncbi:DNA-binding protein SMUBP-2 [Artemisia annua]|uniref:DNA-binding protein SMUBP-2 n=1 Tax=Artemisia annua TaxID=35608 RepID=A0A2U1PC02_ARTAN|nr:DNA-binding protein SMUBP-2 [Artemisia annua]